MQQAVSLYPAKPEDRQLAKAAWAIICKPVQVMPLGALSTDVTSSCDLTVCLVYECPVEIIAACGNADCHAP